MDYALLEILIEITDLEPPSKGGPGNSYHEASQSSDKLEQQR